MADSPKEVKVAVTDVASAKSYLLDAIDARLILAEERYDNALWTNYGEDDVNDGLEETGEATGFIEGLKAAREIILESL
jgi:hypothetical protein